MSRTKLNFPANFRSFPRIVVKIHEKILSIPTFDDSSTLSFFPIDPGKLTMRNNELTFLLPYESPPSYSPSFPL